MVWIALLKENNRITLKKKNQRKMNSELSDLPGLDWKDWIALLKENTKKKLITKTKEKKIQNKLTPQKKNTRTELYF